MTGRLTRAKRPTLRSTVDAGLTLRDAQRAAHCAALAAVALACSRDERPGPEKAAPPPASAAPANAPAASASPPAPVFTFAPVPDPPKSLGPMRTPPNNPTTPAKVRLGQQLFFDPALSVDGTRACYSCHQNEDGTGGHEPTAIGAKNTPLPRHSPTLWNVGYLPKLYWDGRSDSLEAQAKAAWAGGNMGVGQDNLAAKAEEIGDKPEYAALFKAAFPGIGATPDTVVQALSAYERTLFCGDTKLDRYVAGDSAALNDQQKAGMELFTGKAACHSCHTPPFFSDAYQNEEGAYHNVGSALRNAKDPAKADVGRQKISQNPADYATFKTPTLRNVTRSAPYLHDGSFAKLEDTVRFMAGGGFKNPALDPKMIDKKLSDDEIEKLIAFLGALECTGVLTPPTKP
jgi:cytochrome c peroxidase